MTKQIFKHCEKKFNIARNSQTLLLGTLKHYRDGDPDSEPFIDLFEGKRQITNNGENFSMNPQQISALTPNIQCSGITGNGGTLNINFDVPNCYIFSCSLASVNYGAFPKYNSCYSLPDLDLTRDIILMTLYNQLKLSDLDIDPKPPLNTLKLNGRHSEIIYLDDDAFHFNGDNINEVIKRNESHSPYFTKSKKRNQKNYECEQEYRFCFYITDQNGVMIPVKKKPKIIKNVEPLRSLCLDVSNKI